MTGNQVTICIEDDVVEIEKLFKELESWSSLMFTREWCDIERHNFDSSELYERSKDSASERNYQRHLTIEKLRAKLLCE